VWSKYDGFGHRLSNGRYRRFSASLGLGGDDRFPSDFGLSVARRETGIAIRNGLPITEITHTQADAGRAR
jgi:hypothetical protein